MDKNTIIEENLKMTKRVLRLYLIFLGTLQFSICNATEIGCGLELPKNTPFIFTKGSESPGLSFEEKKFFSYTYVLPGTSYGGHIAESKGTYTLSKDSVKAAIAGAKSFAVTNRFLGSESPKFNIVGDWAYGFSLEATMTKPKTRTPIYMVQYALFINTACMM